MFVIEDGIHAEWVGPCERLEDALAELRRRAAIPWDQPPNRPPCTSSQTCRREYELQEYDASQTPWKLLRRAPVLNISARGAEWVGGFE